jgi:ABC-type transport system substrate-binding protein
MHSLAPDGLARFLLAAAEPGNPFFRDDFSNLLSGVSIAPEGVVRLQLTRVHVRPEAHLQLPPPAFTSRYSVADYTPEQVLFVERQPMSGTPAAIRAIVEQSFADDEAAFEAIVSGDIDVLDRVPPWQLERLRTVQGVRVENYLLPTVHVLIPNVSRPLLAKREFRRALCFGIDRQWILERVLLGGATKPGFEVLSGPFPAGVSLSDPLRYGYNNRITPRPFEPRLAAILATVAWSSIQKPAGKKDAPVDPPPMPELTLAHPNEPVARIACQAIQMQLDRAGIPIKLREFSADELLLGGVDCDLRYAELAMWEPLTDARTLLGPGGLAGNLRSPYLDAALPELDKATNWNDVRARLAELHDIAHHELPVIPLWQTMNHFAYRASLRGIGDTPVLLYQNIDEWVPVVEAKVAQRAPGPQ